MMTRRQQSVSYLLDGLWEKVKTAAVEAGLDAEKFDAVHYEIFEQIVHFLAAERPQRDQSAPQPKGLGRLTRGVARRLPIGKREETAHFEPISPIIICGEPGTGKTTFLYVLDTVLRHHFGLPDNVAAEMMARNGRVHLVQKRVYNCIETSLLSVRKWSELLHFFAWDTEEHRLKRDDLSQFIAQTLASMRVIFADEVEIAGYSPAIPDLAHHGLLVVGTSNQSEFKQLESEQIPARIYHFEGVDMRLGEPEDAIVSEDSRAWALFEQLFEQGAHEYERLPYCCLVEEGVVLVGIDFGTAVRTPFLETDWVHFMRLTYQTLTQSEAAMHAQTPFLLLLDEFSLELLRTDYNAIIRFVSLFDAVEQLGIGVLVRKRSASAELSREAISHMKVTINSARGVPDKIKRKALVGIDRCASRIGQAGSKAGKLLAGKGFLASKT